MNINNLQNSISLIGPMSVGKSLIAGELSQKLNYPKINIDELITVAMYEADGMISTDTESQKKFIDICYEELEEDKDLRSTITNPQYSEEVSRLVYEMVDVYNYYKNLIGDFKPLYPIITKYKNSCKQISKDPMESNAVYNKFTMEILKHIFSKIATPVILDSPGPLGWQSEEYYYEDSALENLRNCDFNIDINELEKETRTLLNTTTTVFLRPGKDYATRNDSRHIKENKILTQSLNNYSENAKIEITTNSLFNNPDDPCFKQRNWFDARETLAKAKLKNKGEVANICDQIINHIQELSM